MKTVLAIVISHIILLASCNVPCGVKYEEEHWPWLTSVLTRTPSGLDFLCGGTLITEKHVILPAHCVQDPYRPEVIMKDLIINIGKSRLFTAQRDSGVTTSVSEIVVHPHYNGENLDSAFDIAVLVLTDSMMDHPKVRPACLWDNIAYNKREQIFGQVTGWLKDHEGKIEETSSSMPMQVFSHEECVATSEHMRRSIANNTFCARINKPTGPCDHENGGEMYVLERVTMDHRWVLRGTITKFVSNEHDKNICEFAVFSDVTVLLPWIKRVVIKHQDLRLVPLVDKKYYFSKPEESKLLSWREAKDFCSLHEMELARFDSVMEHEMFTALVNEVEGGEFSYWIDGTDEDHEGSWVWSSTLQPLKFSAWNPTQPDNYMRGEHCLGINPHQGLQNWHDIPCSYKIRFVCQKYVEQPLPAAFIPENGEVKGQGYGLLNDHDRGVKEQAKYGYGLKGQENGQQVTGYGNKGQWIIGQGHQGSNTDQGTGYQGYNNRNNNNRGSNGGNDRVHSGIGTQNGVRLQGEVDPTEEQGIQFQEQGQESHSSTIIPEILNTTTTTVRTPGLFGNQGFKYQGPSGNTDKINKTEKHVDDNIGGHILEIISQTRENIRPKPNKEK